MHAEREKKSVPNVPWLLGRGAVLPEVSASSLKITVTHSGNNLVLTWPVGVIYEADNVAGPYSKVNGAASPETITPT